MHDNSWWALKTSAKSSAVWVGKFTVVLFVIYVIAEISQKAPISYAVVSLVIVM